MLDTGRVKEIDDQRFEAKNLILQPAGEILQAIGIDGRFAEAGREHLRVALDGCQWGLQFMGSNRDKFLTGYDRALRFVVQSRVVDRDGRTTSQVLDEFQIGGSIMTAGFGGYEGYSSKRPSTGEQRHNHGGREPHHPEHFEVFGVARGLLEHGVRNVHEKLRLSGAQYMRQSRRAIWIERVALEELSRPLDFIFVYMGDGQTPNRFIVADDMNRAPVGELRYRELGQVREGMLVVERLRQDSASLGKKRKSLAMCLRQGACSALGFVQSCPFKRLSTFLSQGAHQPTIVLGEFT